MIAIEKIQEYMMLVDKAVEMNAELDKLVYRCLDDHSLMNTDVKSMNIVSLLNGLLILK